LRPRTVLAEPKKEDNLPEAEKALRKMSFVRFVLPLALMALTVIAVGGIIYYSNIKTTEKAANLVSNGDSGMPIPANQDIIKDENLAQERFARAEAQEENASNKSSIQEAIRLYEKILTECPRSRLIPKVEEKISHLKERIRVIDEKKSQETQEKDALAEYDKLKDDINRSFEILFSGTDTGVAEVLTKESIGKLDTLDRKYSVFASVADLVYKKKTDIQRWYAKFQEVGQKYKNLQNRVESCVVEEQFDIALQQIRKFIDNPEYKNTIYNNVANDYYKKTERDAEKAFKNIMKRVDDLISVENFIQAEKLLVESQGNYGIESIEQEIKNKLNWFKAESSFIHNRMLEKESEKITGAYISLLFLVQKGFLDKVEMETKNVGLQFQTAEYKKKMMDFIGLIVAEKNIIKKFIRRLNEGTTYHKKIGGKNIVFITNGLVTLEGDPKSIEWEKITARDWEVAISTAWDLTPDDYMDLGVLCAKRGGLPKAKEYFNTASKTKDNLETKRRAQKYEQGVAAMIASRNEEVIYILEESEKLFAKQKYSDAIRGFWLLKTRYSNIIAMDKNTLSLVTQRYGECEKGIK